MASANTRQRYSKDEPTLTSTAANKTRRDNRMAMAKRGFRSLAIAVAVPFFLTVATSFLFGSPRGYPGAAKPFWHPPRWAIHMGSLSTASLMGLAAWLVWAEGGFRREPAALPLYLSQLLLGILWGPLVFRAGALRTGLVACVGLASAQYGCSQVFRKVNPIAADLVKPCIAWASFLAILTYKLA